MIPDVDDRGVLGELAMKAIAMLRRPPPTDRNFDC